MTTKTTTTKSKTPKELSGGDVKAIEDLRVSYEDITSEVGKIIIGQEAVIERMLTCMLSRGHALLMGVPGLAKTLLVNSLAQTTSLSFGRIQFTPDLMPSDVTGTEILQSTGEGLEREFVFAKGPLFANVILADEINRTPPKTQSALLEAMQEKRVTVAGKHHTLPEPFFVLATQNPIEQEGTYPLPEAQLDRFMFLIQVEYPSRDEEIRISQETTTGDIPKLKKVITGKKLREFQGLVERVPVPDHVHELAVDIVRRTRPNSDESPAWLRRWVQWGAGPRAVQFLIRGAKARAVLHGNYMASTEDIEAVAEPVLFHRILTNFHARSEGMTSSEVVKRLITEARKEKR
ncbi:MAG: AAA family ATPase [Opitutae bacterium]|jgi:MoxR-like ATPase|nr:AAA family ATPase [Opitutae bacterium]MBT5909188.1 AAA family ATPase [Opitutae bacterium]MBT6849737.1 AAA family ATPase [Opitutae bacterium]MBT7743624.1 AAA family ATPase [Opitutae bacterium]MBT7923958.1 AAA family ATPase [Opitutae bacterium]